MSHIFHVTDKPVFYRGLHLNTFRPIFNCLPTTFMRDPVITWISDAESCRQSLVFLGRAEPSRAMSARVPDSRFYAVNLCLLLPEEKRIELFTDGTDFFYLQYLFRARAQFFFKSDKPTANYPFLSIEGFCVRLV